MHPQDPTSPSAPLFGMYIGYVTDRDDPKGLGRVRVCIPGFIEESTTWARQLGLGGGAASFGTKFVPPLNAEVAVFFQVGDVERPFYVGGPQGTADTLTGDDASPDVRTIETPGFVISIDDRPETRSLTLFDKTNESAIQINAVDASISMKATSQITLECDGFIVLRGLEVIVNDIPSGMGRL